MFYNKDTKTLVFEGVCMPENAVEMFAPIFEFISKISARKVNIELNFKYLNSMSSKQLLRLFLEIYENFQNFEFIWKYDEDDELMKMKGEEFEAILETPNFKIVTI